MRWLIVILIVRYGRAQNTSTPGSTEDFCETETFQPRCPGNQVITMVTARYGRMEMGRCAGSNLGYIGCFEPVLHIMDNKCSGRSSCDVRIPDGELDATRPCLKELRAYLTAAYNCTPVAWRDQMCSQSMLTVDVNKMASISSRHVHNSVTCPGSRDQMTRRQWIFQTRPGRTLNISLVDFASNKYDDDNDDDGDDEMMPDHRVLYGYIIDKTDGRNISVYGGGDRERHLLLTNGSMALITLFFADDINYLITYKAVGCADLRSPKHSWMTRTQDKAVIGCDETHQTWHLLCVRDRWSGVIGNCTQHMMAARKLAVSGGGYYHLSHDMTILLIAAVSLIICAVIALTGILCLKRLNRKRCCQGCGPVKYDNVQTDDAVYKDSDPTYLSPQYAKNEQAPPKNKNDYSHIWQHPLPVPLTSHDVTVHQNLQVKLPHRVSSGQRSADSASDDAYHVSMMSKSSGSDSNKYFVIDKELRPLCPETGK